MSMTIDDAIARLEDEHAFIEAKLAESREHLGRQLPVIPVKDGEGNTVGVRDNPCFSAYMGMVSASGDILARLVKLRRAAEADAAMGEWHGD